MSINPVRYPGGKGSKKIAERVLSLYSDGHFKNKIWVEPFAGGCGLGLYMMEHGLVSKCVFNDYDPRIRDMWKVIAYHSDRLIMELDRLDIGIERFFEAREIANNDSSSTFQRGYNTYILNRCARSGYIDGGAIGGNEQKGNYKIDCRFNIENLVKKIEKIGDLAEAGKIVFTSGHDGCDLIDNLLTQYGVPEEMFLYVDPPYYDKGKACYKERVDHDAIQQSLLNTDVKWLLSYDRHPYIMGLYAGKHIEDLELTYSNNSKTRGKAREMLIMSEDAE